MTTNHAPGRITVDIADGPWVAHAFLRMAGWGCVARIGLDYSLPHWDGPQRANAHRLAACWNACLGMEDPEGQITELRRQNEIRRELLWTHGVLLKVQTARIDELLQVARDFDEALRELGLHCECGEADCRTTRLRAAIAKETGGKVVGSISDGSSETRAKYEPTFTTPTKPYPGGEA